MHPGIVCAGAALAGFAIFWILELTLGITNGITLPLAITNVLGEEAAIFARELIVFYGLGAAPVLLFTIAVLYLISPRAIFLSGPVAGLFVWLTAWFIQPWMSNSAILNPFGRNLSGYAFEVILLVCTVLVPGLLWYRLSAKGRQ